MPLTLSHPAAVLPIAGLLRGRVALPTSALVAGSTVPDLPLFIGTGYGVSHSAVGVVTLDLVLALLALLVWDRLVRDALADLAPDRWRDRLEPRRRLSRRQWLLAPPAAVLGAATHVLWDSFTHEGRWGAARVGWLERDHLGLAGADWAQYVSSVVGLLLVVAACEQDRRRRPLHERGRRVLPWALLPVAVGAAALVGATGGLLAAPGEPSNRLFHVAVDTLVAVGLATVAVSVVRWFRVRSTARAGGRPRDREP